jgi:hypothetical protein
VSTHTLAVEQVAATVALAWTVPGVVAIGRGDPGEPATYGPAGTVHGAAVRDGVLQIVVVADARWPLLDLADRLRTTINWGGPVDIDIVDVVDLDAPPTHEPQGQGTDRP